MLSLRMFVLIVWLGKMRWSEETYDAHFFFTCELSECSSVLEKITHLIKQFPDL
jgi:hypothetical protein